MNQPIEIPKWWRYLAMSLFVVTLAVVLFYMLGLCILSDKSITNCNLEYAIDWVRNTKYFAGNDIGLTIGLSVYIASLLASSCCLAGLSLIGVIVGWRLQYPLRVYILTFATSILPLTSLVVLHFMGI